MKKKFLILLALALLIASVLVYKEYNKPHKNVADETPAFSLTASALFDAFEQDEVKANTTYLDKIIAVEGKVVSEEKNQEGKTILMLEAENAMIGGVLCTMQGNEAIGVAQIKLKCRCTGFLDDVVLVDCVAMK